MISLRKSMVDRIGLREQKNTKRPMNLIVNIGKQKPCKHQVKPWFLVKPFPQTATDIGTGSSLEQTKIACDRGGKSPEFELSRFLIFHPSYGAHKGFQSMRVALNNP